MSNESNDIKQNAISKFLSWVDSLYEKIGDADRPLFFRGHADDSWSLLPSVMRDSKSNERTLILDFKQVFEMESNYLENLESILTRMQHHEIPTRLLDWTISPLQALYFACNNENKKDKDAKVCAFNPWNTYKEILGTPDKPTYYFELMKRARLLLALGWSFEEILSYIRKHYNYTIRSKELYEPLPIVGRYFDNRVSYQEGMFLLWGNDKLALDFQPSYRGNFEEFKISATEKPNIISILAKLGITEFTTYRDIDGFKRAVDNSGSIFKIK